MRAGWPSCCASIISTPSITASTAYGALKELVRSYLTITKDLVRVMTRVKAIYRSWAIPCTGKQVYAAPLIVRSGWGRSTEPGVRRRAEFYYQQLDALRVLRQQVRGDLLAESKKQQAWKRLCQIPFDGSDPGRRVVGHRADTPSVSAASGHFGNTAGLAIETHSSADHCWSQRAASDDRRSRSSFAD